MFYFEKMDMASEHNKGLIKNARLVSGANYVEMKPGYFAKIKGITADDLYSDAFTRALGAETVFPNYNGYDAVAPSAITTDKVVVCDPAVVATAKGANGLVYRIGNETYGNSLEAGKLGRVREVVLNDLFKLGNQNFKTAPTVGKYAILTANEFTLTPATDIPASGFTVEIIKQIYETTGAELAKDPAYIVRVVQL